MDVRGSARRYDVRVAQVVLKIAKCPIYAWIGTEFQDLRSPSPIMSPARERIFHGW